MYAIKWISDGYEGDIDELFRGIKDNQSFAEVLAGNVYGFCNSEQGFKLLVNELNNAKKGLAVGDTKYVEYSPGSSYYSSWNGYGSGYTPGFEAKLIRYDARKHIVDALGNIIYKDGLEICKLGCSYKLSRYSYGLVSALQRMINAGESDLMYITSNKTWTVYAFYNKNAEELQFVGCRKCTNGGHKRKILGTLQDYRYKYYVNEDAPKYLQSTVDSLMYKLVRRR